MERKQHVIYQLQTLPASAGLKLHKDHAMIRCPVHGGGQERTPSLKINLTDGKFKAGSWSCFGCGCQADMQGGGTWNNLAELLHVEGIGRRTGDAVPHGNLLDSETDNEDTQPAHQSGEKKLSSSFTEGFEDEFDFSFADDFPPWNPNKDWRGITGATLSAVGARRGVDKWNRDRMWLPILVNGSLYSSIFCTYQKGNPSYLYDGSKDITYAVFPYDYVKSMNKNYVVIVEGSRDALHLIDHGVPALAVLGGNTSWNKYKRDLIMTLKPELIVLAPDPDEVGNKLAKAMKEDFKTYFVPTRWFRMKSEVVDGKLKKKEDPGDLTAGRINYLKKSVKNFFSNKNLDNSDKE